MERPVALGMWIAKPVGLQPPYPVYEVPFRFRSRDRHLWYALFMNDLGVITVQPELRCLSEVEPNAQPGHDCLCCPALTQVENLAVLATVTADIGKQGEPIVGDDLQ